MAKKTTIPGRRGGGALLPRPTTRKGWRPDTPDMRDHVFNPNKTGRRVTTLPPAVDLRLSGHLPSVYDQGQLGSCTANAIAAAYQYENHRQGLVDYNPSRLFIYYGERAIEGTIASDAGAEIRDGFKVIAHQGAPHEPLWPYVEKDFAVTPARAAFEDGTKHLALTYARVAVTLDAVKRALAASTPVVLGFTVYESFESDAVANTGLVPIPKATERNLGGHAVLAVGYKMIRGALYLIIRNSWGAGWGDAGYCYIRASWLVNTNNADDFWAIQTVEASAA